MIDKKVCYVGVPLQNELVEKTEKSNKSSTEAKIYTIPRFSDMRGSLNALELGKQIPFLVKRVFYAYDTPSSVIRGEHAHKKCHQFLIPLSGSLNVIADDGQNRDEFTLDSPSKGLYLPPGIWGVQYKHQSNTILLVLASHEYDKDDYIRDYSVFINYIKNKSRHD